MPFTEVQAHRIINKLLRDTNWTHATTWFVSIHSGDPGENGASEITSYDGNRKAVVFDAPSSKVTQNAGALTYENMPAVTVTHVGIWDAATGGNFLWGGALEASKAVSATDTFLISAGDLEVTLT